jgi:hypothetical protein
LEADIQPRKKAQKETTDQTRRQQRCSCSH